MSRVVVVGAGLAGLTAARYLARAGVEVTVLESSDRVGGRVTSDSIDGYICDRGFQVINPSYPEIKRLGLMKNLTFNPISPNIRLVDIGALVGLGHIASTLSKNFGSFSEKLAFGRFVLTQQSSEESLGDLATKFPTLYQKVLKPFLKAVFLTDPDLVAGEVAREIISSFITGRPGVPARGVAQFSEELASGLVDIRFNSAVESVIGNRVSGNFDTIHADFVVVASDPATATNMLSLVELPRMLASTTWYHSVGEEIVDSRYLAVCAESSLVNSVVISQVSPEYAPAGKHLVSSTSLLPLSESEVRRELSKIWRTDTRDWELVAHYEIKQSLPLKSAGVRAQYPVAISERTFVVGDHRNLPSQQGAMKSGRLAAEEIIRQLEASR